MKKSVHTPEYALLKSILRDARQNAGLSQRQLAAHLGIPHTWISKVESGERRIDLVEFGWFMTACGADAVAACKKLLHGLKQKETARRRQGGGRK